MNLFGKAKNFILGIRLRERMLLLYLIGGILPLLLANIYMYSSMRSVMLTQAGESAIEQLEVSAESLSESMSVIEHVSKNLYFNSDIEHIATCAYTDYEEILADYRNFTAISDYQNNYYQEISGITIYTYNTTLSDNEYFVYADASVKSARWYINALDLKGAPYWYSSYDSMTKKNTLCMSRALYTSDFELIGVIRAEMQNKRSELLVSGQDQDTLLLYDDYMVLHSNFDIEDSDEILNLIIKEEGDSGSDRVTYQGRSYLLSYVRVYPEYSDEYYTFLSLQLYSQIAWVATKAALNNIVPMIVCIAAALLLLGLFSNSFAVRINEFKDQMHKVAGGDFKIAETISGNDEIADLYQDLNEMIRDIQELMDTVVAEKVQKEQLNTRKKEVEFKMLASQINPHFLYNTLETIRMEARVNKQPDIEELAKMLAKIMRHNIQVGDTMQLLSDELLQVQYYLKIQDYRFHDRIAYAIEADEDAIRGLKIMPLLIQPYVENAYVHGLESKESGGRITITVETGERLTIRVADNGCGMDEEELKTVRTYLNDFDNLDRTHIGIANVNQRIRLQYGEDYGVTIDSVKNEGTTVTILLPLET